MSLRISRCPIFLVSRSIWNMYFCAMRGNAQFGSVNLESTILRAIDDSGQTACTVEIGRLLLDESWYN